MRALITGGLGFVGRSLARGLLAAGHGVVVLDSAPGELPGAEVVVGDICDQESLAPLLGDADTVFHLAALRGGQSERDFDLALRVNLDGSRAVLEACRAREAPVPLVFASTLAVFGGGPECVDETTRPSPATTYGAAKAAVELLVSDYTRKGFLDGRVARLPTVIVRPDAPTVSASGFASAIVRETIAARDYDLPVLLETRFPVIGIETLVRDLMQLAAMPAQALAPDPVVILPSLSVTAAELLGAAARAGGSGKVYVRPDPEIESIVAGWPRAASAERALALGLPADASLDGIVRDYMEEADA